MIPQNFHFLRPEWLLVLIPALALALLAHRKLGRGRDDWRNLVDAHLLRHLAVRDGGGARRWPLALMLGGFALAAMAMAGPTWEKVPVPALDRLDPTVIVLSLAQSMNATDQNPSRLVAARHKVDDILRRMKGGQVALVIYADAPFVAAPLTEDGRVIAQMLPELATDLMPVLNDRPDLAIRQAEELLKNTGATTGRIILLTDGAGDVPDRTLAAARAAAQAGYSVQVIGVGGAKPVPLVAFDGQTLRARDGTARTTQLDAERLNEVAASGGGRFVRLASDAGDIDAVLNRTPPGAKPTLQNSGLNADEWVDMGPYLVLALVLIAPLVFRRGWLAALPLALVLSSLAAPPAARAQTLEAPPPASSSLWKNLWRTPDQQGAESFAGGDYAGAASTFQNPSWQASALYRNGDFDKAASAYGGGAGDDYNRGNALARAGKLREAVAAYDAALKANPADEDAAHNREIVLKALEQQQKQQDQDQQNQQNQDQKNDGQQKQDQKSDGKQDQAQQQPN
ncbi:MAG: VWA domain-containing protein, partial [Pseudomonadota bacterium]